MNATMLLLSLTAVLPAETRDSFTHDFRAGGTLPRELSVFGPEANQFLDYQPGGLRITLPAKRAKIAAVGVSPTFGVSGDFQVGAAFELLAVERPRTGFGSGVNLHMILKSPREEAVTVARYTRVSEGDAYFINRSLKNKQGKMEHRMKTFPCRTIAGRIALKRAGSKIYYLVADSLKSELREIDSVAVGTEDIGQIRLAANTGGSPSLLDVRLLDLRIGAIPPPTETVGPILPPTETIGSIPPPDESTQSSDSFPASFDGWVVLAGAGIALVVILGIALYRRRRIGPQRANNNCGNPALGSSK